MGKEDSVPQTQGAVSQDEYLCVMTVQTACTVKLKIPESSPGRAEEDFQVPARRTASRSSTELRESLFWCPV